MQLLQRLLDNRKTRTDRRDAIMADAEARGDDAALTPEEETAFRQLVDELRAIDEQVPVLREQMLADAAAADARRALGVMPGLDVRVTSEPHTYRPGGEFSWFRDMARAADLGTRDARAAERLGRHNTEMEDLAKRGGLEQRVNPNTTDGQGGEFVQVAA